MAEKWVMGWQSVLQNSHVDAVSVHQVSSHAEIPHVTAQFREAVVQINAVHSVIQAQHADIRNLST